MNQVFRRRVAPRHVFPHRAVGVPLVIQVVDTILVEHAVGVVHPAIHRCVMVLRAEPFAVCRIKLIALLHLAPAEEIFHGTRKAAIAVECDVQQQFLRTKTLNVQGYIVVHLVHCQAHVQRLHLLSCHNHADVGIFFSLLYWQEQIAVSDLNLPDGVALAQHLWSLLCRCSCHH